MVMYMKDSQECKQIYVARNEMTASNCSFTDSVSNSDCIAPNRCMIAKDSERLSKDASMT
jgi:hypothetical protein